MDNYKAQFKGYYEETISEEAGGEAVWRCLICGDTMLYWQFDSHVLYAHKNLERWQYAVNGEHFEVCSYCASIIKDNYEMVQTDWQHWFAEDDNTDNEHDLWQSFNYRNTPFGCYTCLERSR